jgi:hypothetical protein
VDTFCSASSKAAAAVALDGRELELTAFVALVGLVVALIGLAVLALVGLTALALVGLDALVGFAALVGLPSLDLRPDLSGAFSRVISSPSSISGAAGFAIKTFFEIESGRTTESPDRFCFGDGVRTVN